MFSQFWKRIVSMMLVCCMLFSAIPTLGLAEDEDVILELVDTEAAEEVVVEPTAAPTVKPTLPPVDDSDDVPKTGDSHFVTSMFVMAAMAFAVAYLVLHVKSRKEN